MTKILVLRPWCSSQRFYNWNHDKGEEERQGGPEFDQSTSISLSIFSPVVYTTFNGESHRQATFSNGVLEPPNRRLKQAALFAC